MIPFQERKKIRKILYSRVSLFALSFALLFVGKGAWEIHKKAQIAREERNIAVNALRDLEARTIDLQASLAVLKSEQGLEETVRQKYTVAKAGEDVVVVVDGSLKKGENSETGNSRSLWQRFVDIFTE